MPVSRRTAPRFVLVGWIERRSRRQRLLGGTVVVLLALWWLIRRLADLLLDRWWLATVSPASIWSTRLTAQVWLAALTTVVVLGLLGSTSWLVLRTVPGPRPAWLDRYHDRMGPAHRWAVVGVTVVVTWRFATAATTRWQEWLLFRHARNLSTPVPEVGGDLGDHLFRLPFLALATDALRLTLVICVVVAVIGHLSSGALTWPRGGRRIAPVVPAHLAVLATALLAAQALRTILVTRPSLATNRTGRFDGPGYVELTITSPGLWVLALASLVWGAVIIVAVSRQRTRPLLVVGAGWLVLHGLVLVALPAVVNGLVVAPAEAARQTPYIAHNLDATTDAYRLDLVERSDVSVSDGLGSTPTDEQIAAVDRVPLFDPTQLVSSFQVLQGTAAARITDIDLDRYEIDAERRPVLIAARNASRRDLPERGWVQSTLVYTHGNGVVVAPADTPAVDGRPDLVAASDLLPVRSELYHGEGLDGWYAIVGTKRSESGDARFDAATGVPLDSMWRRLVVALSVGDHEPLFSAELTDESQLLLRRGLRERLNAIAPFLRFDGNAYPAVVDDRVVWIVDGYTTSATYPYAQFASTANLPSSSGLRGRAFNYLHASVRATVDAYSGETTLYRNPTTGADDPILDVWADLFPDMFRSLDEMPDALRRHLRYPADLLTVQADMLGRYHVEDAEALFDGTQRWSVSPAPDSRQTGGPTTAPEVSLFSPPGQPDAGQWVGIRTFSPGAASNPNSGRESLAAYLVADHDDAERARLVTVSSTTSRQITSPRVAQSTIDADPTLAREFALLTSNGSQVSFGPMTMVPFDGAIVWIRPVLVVGTATSSTPHLYTVLAVSSGAVGKGDTAGEALIAAVRQSLDAAD